MKKNFIIAVVLVVLFAGTAFFALKRVGQNSASVPSGKIPVVASIYPLYYFATQVGGDKADVTTVVPAGAEPHDYEPTAQDMVTMENSRLIILNGGGLESWGDNIRKNINSSKTIIVVAGEGLTTEKMMENGQEATDPHVWLDPPLAEKMVDRIAQGFEQVDPVNANYYQANADTLKAKLSGLDAEYRQGLSNCAEKNIITSHAAFGYLAMTYGFKQVPIAGLSPDAEPSPSQLADIVQFAKDNNVKYIFFESLVSPKLAQTIASEVGAQTLVLDPLEGLSSDKIIQGRNYLTVMRDNLANLQIALGCSP